jgi:hypothetical protein
MRTPALSLALATLMVASDVRAGAIMPVEGDCPPELDVAIAGHAEVCSPRACTADVQCGARAKCGERIEPFDVVRTSRNELIVMGSEVVLD